MAVRAVVGRRRRLGAAVGGTCRGTKRVRQTARVSCRATIVGFGLAEGSDAVQVKQGGRGQLDVALRAAR